MLLILCIMAIGVLILNIKGLQKNPYLGIRIIVSLLLILSSSRYITLLLYAYGPSSELIQKMQIFYYITMIGINIPFIITIWYITPLYREKLRPIGLGLLCAPHTMIYIAMIVLKPFKLIKSQRLGYILRLNKNWALYLPMIQIIFIVLYIIFAGYGIKRYKDRQTRSQYLILIMCQVLFLLDGLSYFGLGSPVIPAFTLTEVFGFLAIYYGLSRPRIDQGQKRLSSRA